jgi:hypothetical protein
MNDAAPTAEAPAQPLPILYRSVVPLNRERHRNLRLKPLARPLSFTAGSHLLPAMVDEFAAAAREIPIVFLPENDAVVPLFLFSVRTGHNSFVTAEGMWTLSYIPAYIRRYPFILADVAGRDPILCFDESFEGFNTEAGEALFEADGGPTKVLQDMMQFAGGIKEATQRTIQFARRLKELGLFRTVSVDVKSKTAGQASINGLLVIDETKLKALPEPVVAELHRLGYLPAIYAHLFSLGAMTTLS